MLRKSSVLVFVGVILSSTAFADAGLVGEWQLRVEGRMGVQTPVLSVVEIEGTFAGRIGGSRGQVEIEKITVDGQKFSFPFAMTTPMGDFELLYSGTRDGDTISGTVQAPRGPVPFTGQRKSK